MKFAIVVSLLSVACACTASAEKPAWDTVPPPTKLPDGDGIGTPLGDMCANLRAHGCSEGEPVTKNGKTRNCYQAMTVAASNKLSIPVECVTKATSSAAVRMCGDPRTELTFRCAPK